MPVVTHEATSGIPELTAHCESEEHMIWQDEGEWNLENAEHVGEDVE